MRLISIDVLAAACPALSVADQCQFGGEGLFDQTEARWVIGGLLDFHQP
jgi:hypothetical protein